HQWRFVSEALRDVPGIAIVQSGSRGKTTSAFVRGSDSAQVLVLIDWIPVNDPYFGGVALEELTTDNVERIEVVRGPQSPLYGSESMGGVINIITRNGDPGVHPEARFEGGSFQTFRESAGLSGAAQKFDYSLTIARQDSEGQFDNDEHHESTLSGKGTYRFNAPTELSFVTRVHDSQIGIPFNSSFEPAPDRNQETSSALLGMNLSHSGGEYWNPTVRASFTRIDFLFEDPEDFFPLSRHDSGILQATIQNDFRFGKSSTLSAGMELENRSINASDHNGEIVDLNDFEDDIYSFFAQNKYQSNRWIVTGGFRVDHHTSFGDAFNPRISAAFLP
ncbi:MAG: TonB-dependent receptor plug domain-containing protein, partial [Acidobacteriota bacterium]